MPVRPIPRCALLASLVLGGLGSLRSTISPEETPQCPGEPAAPGETAAPGEPAAPDEPAPVAWRVVTYNIRHGRGMDGRVDMERTAAVLRRLEPDIVALQEVDERAERSGRVDQAAELGRLLGMHPAFGSFFPYQEGRYGMAVLSRRPIKSVRSVGLPPGNEPRVALAVEIERPDLGSLMVVNVHLDWVRDDTFRLAQAEELARFLDGVDMPFILLGDFNDEPGSRTLDLFLGRAIEAAKPPERRLTFPSDDPRREIDFVLAAPRGAWRTGTAEVVEEAAASDHRPVLAVLEHLGGGEERLRAEPIGDGLILDLDADRAVEVEEGDRVVRWTNQVASSPAGDFVKRDEGRREAGSGRPTLKRAVGEIGGRSTVVFRRQELINHHEDAFDHLIRGSGYTWLAVIRAYPQVVQLKDVNSIFGNLRNDGNFEGIWGNLTDDNRPWAGSRNGRTFGRWDANNPMVVAPEPLETDRYHVVAARMEAGVGEVAIELFVGDSRPVARKPFPVNPEADSSKMAVGEERDATNHPGVEAFDGEIARLLIYERPLTRDELDRMLGLLKTEYKIP